MNLSVILSCTNRTKVDIEATIKNGCLAVLVSDWDEFIITDGWDYPTLQQLKQNKNLLDEYDLELIKCNNEEYIVIIFR